MTIRAAVRTDANDITELTMRSKNHWGYGDEQIEKWREELTITPQYIQDNQIFKGLLADKLVGFYAYDPIAPKMLKLNYLFVDPIYIGKGYGKILLTDFLQRIKNSKYDKVTLDADPNAEQFYKTFGFKTVGQLETSIKDRFLPIMELALKTALLK